MNSNWTFKLVVCFIAFYIVTINCQSSIGDEEDKGQSPNETWIFDSTKNVTNETGKNVPQINCEDDLCKKLKLTFVNCTGKFQDKTFLESNLNYTCSSDSKDIKKYNANYTIYCKNPKEKDNHLNENCWVNVSLKEKSNQYINKSNVGIVIGIIIGLIVIMIAIVALLGWRGIGPMKRIFNS